ncbi:glycoside hydrolase [Cubamyces sp. BRFM 1775]|nr:glycoside hydrolase [Cubamyces sp. BRFM 1775]
MSSPFLSNDDEMQADNVPDQQPEQHEAYDDDTIHLNAGFGRRTIRRLTRLLNYHDVPGVTYSLATLPETVHWDRNIIPGALTLNDMPVRLRIVGEITDISYGITPSNNPVFQLHLDMEELLEAEYIVTFFPSWHYIYIIAGAGLNWIRLPIPFWAINKWNDIDVDASGATVVEPFLAKTCWTYILRVLGWARKYGLRVNLDLHTMPGSQNGYNHSGKLGSINWMKGVMGLANPEWRNVMQMFGMVNEPYLHGIGRNEVQSFYLHAYEMVRSITGTGEGNGPMISLYDGFAGPANWAGFLAGSDRVNIDTHPYFAFNGNANREPVNVTADGDPTGGMGGKWPLQANGMNDCGLSINGITPSGAAGGANYGPGCDYWEDWQSWSDDSKAGLKNFVLASMDALGDWFFWTWKIGNSTSTGTVRAPLWSYQLGLEQGWMPADPRTALSKCESLGADLPPSTARPRSMASLPQYKYTATATVATLPPLSFSPSPAVSVGNGWFDTSDNVPAVTAIAGCTYPDAWDAEDAQIPVSSCLPAAR